MMCTTLQLVASNRTYIIPLLDSCPGEIPGELCLTLEQYSLNYDHSSNITLELLPGEHRVNSTFSVWGKESFIMQGTNATLICEDQFRINSTNHAYISGINFSGCRNSEVTSVVNFTLHDCNFYDSSLKLYSTKGTFMQSSFHDLGIGTDFSPESGALSLYSSSVKVERCIFSDCKASGQLTAAAIHSMSSTLTVENCTFTNNVHLRLERPYQFPSTHGGAIYFANGTMTITDSNFTQNAAGGDFFSRGNGGAVFLINAVVSMYGSKFVNNTADGDGGAVWSASGSSVSFDQCVFFNNRAHAGSGGAVHISSVSVIMNKCNFTNNIATFEGGAVVSRSISMNECNFVGNGIRVNSFGGRGGAVYVSIFGKLISTYKVTFFNNTAGGGFGGAIYSRGQDINVSLVETTFSYNSASYCGVLDTHDSYHINTANLTRSAFTNNRATGTLSRRPGGGVLCIRNSTLILVANSTFRYNSAMGDAGVLDVENSTVTVMNSTFDHNSARGNGGVMHSRLHPIFCTIYRSSFTNNKAGGNGGVVYAGRAGSQVKVNDSIFAHNNATERGGALVIAGSTLVLAKSTIVNNTASMGGAISACNSRVTVPSGLDGSNKPAFPFCTFYEGNTIPTLDNDTVTDGNVTSELTGMYIIPSPDSYCLVGITGGLCFTLEEYSSTSDQNPDVILEVQPGEHRISRSSRIGSQADPLKRKSSFIMQGKNATVHCEGNNELRFENFDQVHIHDIDFTDCRKVIVGFSVGDFSLRDCTFQNSPLLVYSTKGLISQSSFVDIGVKSFALHSQFKCNYVIGPKFGALFLERSTLKIRGCTFSNNKAKERAPAIHALTSKLTIEECIFSNNIRASESGSFGGAIYSQFGTISINGSNFTDNVAGALFRECNSHIGHGGALYTDFVDGVVHDSYFVNNTAKDGGGGVYSTQFNVITRQSVSFSKCVFSDNQAETGGAVHVSNAADFTRSDIVINGSIFRNNRANESGGAARIEATNLPIIMNECNFINNRVQYGRGLGGALYITGNGNLISAHGGIFANNTARLGSGGAIYSGGQRIIYSLTETTFSYNSASLCGAIHVGSRKHGSVNFTRSTFTHNKATGESSLNGGGVLCIINGSVSLVNSTFSHNSAAGDAGVLDVVESSVTILHSEFDNNTVGNDGAVMRSFFPTFFTISSSSFTNNQAGGNGGVMYVGGAGSHVTVNENCFANNSASDNGGAIVIIGSTLKVSNNKLMLNTANLGGAITACYGSQVTVSSELINSTNMICTFYEDHLKEAPTAEQSTTDPQVSASTTPTQTEVDTMPTATEGGTTPTATEQGSKDTETVAHTIIATEIITTPTTEADGTSTQAESNTSPTETEADITSTTGAFITPTQTESTTQTEADSKPTTEAHETPTQTDTPTIETPTLTDIDTSPIQTEEDNTTTKSKLDTSTNAQSGESTTASNRVVDLILINLLGFLSLYMLV